MHPKTQSILAAIDSGKPIKTIASEHAICISWVYRLRELHRPHLLRTRTYGSVKRQLIDLIEAGTTPYKASRIIGCNPAYAYQVAAL